MKCTFHLRKEMWKNMEKWEMGNGKNGDAFINNHYSFSLTESSAKNLILLVRNATTTSQISWSPNGKLSILIESRRKNTTYFCRTREIRPTYRCTMRTADICTSWRWWKSRSLKKRTARIRSTLLMATLHPEMSKWVNYFVICHRIFLYAYRRLKCSIMIFIFL